MAPRRKTATAYLDLQGLKCPLPALRTRKALAGMAGGDRLVVTCTDPLAALDIPHLVQQTGDALESWDREGELLVFRILRSTRS